MMEDPRPDDRSRSRIPPGGRLILVPTPVGNLADMTYRAVEVLREVDLICCEDTRTSGVLLAHYAIDTARTSFHMHNEHAKAEQLVQRMVQGQRVALISDAGTPSISDPGFLLVRQALQAGVPVECMPGATALIPALAGSGLPSDRFVFEGFLPVKKGRRTRLDALSAETRTIVLYESPHRLGRTLRDLTETFGEERPACVAREISKQFEEFARGTLGELHADFSNRAKVRGEIVVVIGGAPR